VVVFCVLVAVGFACFIFKDFFVWVYRSNWDLVNRIIK
jgi:hypothetical protein